MYALISNNDQPIFPNVYQKSSKLINSPAVISPLPLLRTWTLVGCCSRALFLLCFPHQHHVYWDWSRLLITDRDYWSLIPAQFWHLNHIFSVQQTEFPLIFIALMLSFHSMQMRSKILWGAVRLIYSYIKSHAAMLYVLFMIFRI